MKVLTDRGLSYPTRPRARALLEKPAGKGVFFPAPSEELKVMPKVSDTIAFVMAKLLGCVL